MSKDENPIKLEMFQTDIEKIMYNLDLVILAKPNIQQINRIKDDLQRKINIHKERGEWF